MKIIPVSFVARIFALAVSLFSLNSFASTVYTQTPSGSGYIGSAVHGFSWGLDGVDTQSWASFTAASSLSFNQITWYGYGYAPVTGSFAVDLISTTCTSCISSLVSNNGGGSFASNLLSSSLYTSAQITTSQIVSNITSYTITLPTTVTLTATTPTSPYYALSVVENNPYLSAAAGFQWALSNTGVGTFLNYTAGRAPAYIAYSGNLAFTLSDTTVAAPVPEPGEWLMMLCGLGLIGFIAFRRRNQQSGPMAFA